jgi:hypothetical protein
MTESSIPAGYRKLESRLFFHGGYEVTNKEAGKPDWGNNIGPWPSAMVQPRTYRGRFFTAIAQLWGVDVYGKEADINGHMNSHASWPGNHAVRTTLDTVDGKVWSERAEALAKRGIYPDVTLEALAHVDPGHFQDPKDPRGKSLRRQKDMQLAA